MTDLSPLQSSAPKRASTSERDQIQQYMTIRLASRCYGVPLAQVAEISPNRELRKLPHMPAAMEGLLDLRGRVIPVMNLRDKLGLPPADPSTMANIVILALQSGLLGLMVDRVESVVSGTPEEHTLASSILAGRHGLWVTGFLLRDEQVTVLLNTDQLEGAIRDQGEGASDHKKLIEEHLDESLQHLIQMAPEKAQLESARIIPQMQASIAHTEEEMAKVVERIEIMLHAADVAYQSNIRLRQEVSLGRIKGQDSQIAELEQITKQMQDELFNLLGMIQFQDIARQKLERVLNHIRGLQVTIGAKLRDDA